MSQRKNDSAPVIAGAVDRRSVALGHPRRRPLNFLYVDESNLWISGMYVAAVDRGLAPDLHTAQEKNIYDRSWSFDFGRLLRFAGGHEDEVGRAIVYGSKTVGNEFVWDRAKQHGFEVVTYERNGQGREKKVDAALITDMISDSYARMTPGVDEITLVAGDSDYVPAVQRVRARGLICSVMFWKDHCSRELKESATRFVPLNNYLEHLNSSA